MGHNNRQDNLIILFDLSYRLLAAFSTPDSWWEGPLCKITQFNDELLSSTLLCVCPHLWFPTWKTGYHFNTAWNKMLYEQIFVFTLSACILRFAAPTAMSPLAQSGQTTVTKWFVLLALCIEEKCNLHKQIHVQRT